MEDTESYHKRLRAARMRSKGVVYEIIDHKGERLIAFPQHNGLTAPDELMPRIVESYEKRVEIAFTYDGELTIVGID